MTVNYTTNLALGQPVTGTESGTWGDDVNNAVTSYLDIAIAGGLAITVTTADVTLTITQGTSVATNIGSTTAQYAILNVSGAMTAARNLIVPSSSRIYLINNNTTGGFALTVKGSATTGVTLVNGEKAHVFWNGTDYAKLSNASGGAGVFSSITNSGLTSGRVVYSTTGGLETDSANLTFNGTTLTANTIGAFTLSGTIAGGGNQINNVIIGTTTPLAGAFTTLSATNNVTIYDATLNTPRVLTFSANRTSTGILGTIKFGNTQFANNEASIVAESDGALDSSRLLFSTTPTGGSITERMRLDSSGNLGIGTSSPAYTLEVSKSQDGVTNIAATNANAGTAAQTRFRLNNGGSNFGTISHTGASFTTSGVFRADGTYIFGNGTGGLTLTTGAAQPIYFAINNSEAMRLDSSGNLGIGTSSPGAKLEVAGAAPTIKITANNATPATLQLTQAGVGNWLKYFRVSDSAFVEQFGGTDLLFLSTAGNLGLGVTPSAWSGVSNVFQIKGNAYVASTTHVLNHTANAYYNGTNWIYTSTNFASQTEQVSGTHLWKIAASGTAGDPITFIQAMTLDASGNLLVGTTTTTNTIINGNSDGGFVVQGKQTNGGASVVGFYNAEASSGDNSPVLGISKAMTTTSSSARFVQFFAGGVSTTPMGGIVGNGASNVQFATLSDAREKTNIQLINGSLAKISALKPVEFDWIKSGEHVKAGFVAQDVEKIFPEFVVDNMSSEGEEVRKGLTGGMTGGIIPHLVKAIQEQQALITQLTARITALETV